MNPYIFLGLQKSHDLVITIPKIQKEVDKVFGTEIVVSYKKAHATVFERNRSVFRK